MNDYRQHMAKICVRRAGRAAGVAFMSAVMLPLGAGAAPLPGTLQGGAAGMAISSDPHVLINKLALSCFGTDGTVHSRVTGALSEGNTAQATKFTSTVSGDKNARRATAQNTSEVDGVNLLNGLIKANRVIAVANMLATADNISTSATGSQFGKLTIAGALVAEPAANTVIDLPGIGSVTLNQVRKKQDDNKASISVDMLRVQIEHNNSFGLPVGSSIVVGIANAGYTRAGLPGVAFNGSAYSAGSGASSNSIKLFDRAVNVPCEGTSGKTISKSVGSEDFGETFRSGGATMTGFGGIENSDPVTRTKAKVDNASLLGGVVRANSIVSVATDRLHGGVRISSTHGSAVFGLRVGGVALGSITAKNVSVDVPGIGVLIVNESITPDANSSHPTEANGLHLSVLHHNALGIPVGTQFLVGHAGSLVMSDSSSARVAAVPAD